MSGAYPRREDAARPPGGPPAADGRRARWAEHRAVRRAELVAAAVAAIRRHGPHVGMDDIAAEAGVTKPVIYRYFADKSDLYVAVGQSVAGALLERVTAQIQPARHPREVLVAGIEQYLLLIEESPNVYRFVVSRPFLDRNEGRDLVQDYESLIAASVARFMGAQLRAAGIDSGGVEPWAQGVVGFVRAAGDSWLDRRSMSRADLTDYLVRFLWGGLQELVAPGRALAPSPAGDGKAQRAAGA